MHVFLALATTNSTFFVLSHSGNSLPTNPSYACQFWTEQVGILWYRYESVCDSADSTFTGVFGLPVPTMRKDHIMQTEKCVIKCFGGKL